MTPGSGAAASDGSPPPGGAGRRVFLVWMEAPDFPLWHMPVETERRVREALGEGWTLRRLAAPGHFTGDGSDRVPTALLEAIRDAEVYCGFGLPREAFEAADALRWVHSGAAGVSGTLYPEMRESDVVLTNSAGLHAEPMAEHALAMALHFARGLDVAERARPAGRWAHADLAGAGGPLRELAGRTMGVLGYGGVGSAVGRRAAALGMRVLGLRRRPGDPPPEVDGMLGPDGLDRLLREADVLVVCLPETDETREALGERELGLLGEDGVLINLSRGSIVSEEALVSALAAGRLRGAGLDVFHREPLPPDHPLWELDGVLITPHVAGVSGRFWERETELLVDNVGRYLRGEPLRNVVDKDRGY